MLRDDADLAGRGIVFLNFPAERPSTVTEPIHDFGPFFLASHAIINCSNDFRQLKDIIAHQITVLKRLEHENYSQCYAGLVSDVHSDTLASAFNVLPRLVEAGPGAEFLVSPRANGTPRPASKGAKLGSIADIIGLLAGGMTVVAFGCRRMVLLRCAAIVANLLFIAYGGMLGLAPIVVLHCLLLPLNVLRLLDDRRKSSASGRCVLQGLIDETGTP